MSVTVSPDPAFPAGHAVVRVPGAAAAAGSPGFRVQREEDWEDDKLGPAGWQSSDALLVPDRAEAHGADLVLHIGWAVCRHLEAGVYTFEVPASGQEAAPVFWPDIVPMHAGAVDVNTRAVAPEPAPAAAAEIKKPVPNPAQTAAVRPIAPPQPVPPPPVSPRPVAPPPPIGVPSLKVVLPLFLLLVLVAGGAGYYFWTHRGGPGSTEATDTPPPSPPPSVPPVNAPVPLGRLSVPEVLAQAPNPAAITAEGTRRLQGDRRDDGLLLLEAAADRGDGGASAALARLYDPVLFQPGGPIPKADPRQAARYYRDAARAGADVAAAREALRQSLQTRAQSGDLGANLSLKDFWP